MRDFGVTVSPSSSRSSSTRDASKPSIRSTAPGGCRGRARRHQADELRADDLDAARRGLLLDPRDDLVQRGRLPVLDVHAHLHEPRARQVEARARARPGSRRRVSRTSAAISRADLESSPRRLTLNAISGRRAPTSTPPADRIEPRRPEVGRELARVDAPLQLLRPAAPEERGPAPRRAPP